MNVGCEHGQSLMELSMPSARGTTFSNLCSSSSCIIIRKSVFQLDIGCLALISLLYKSFSMTMPWICFLCQPTALTYFPLSISLGWSELCNFPLPSLPHYLPRLGSYCSRRVAQCPSTSLSSEMHLYVWMQPASTPDTEMWSWYFIHTWVSCQ